VASSEEKRHVQSLKRHARNKAAKSRVKTTIKKVRAAVASGDTTAAESQLRLAMSILQKAGRKRVFHPNTVARRIGKLARLVHRSKSVATPAAS
jgi:small subunit ribosomal protein S20